MGQVRETIVIPQRGIATQIAFLAGRCQAATWPARLVGQDNNRQRRFAGKGRQIKQAGSAAPAWSVFSCEVCSVTWRLRSTPIDAKTPSPTTSATCGAGPPTQPVFPIPARSGYPVLVSE